MTELGQAPVLAAADFQRLRALVFEASGIQLAESKRHLVASRLWSRLRALQLSSYGEYVVLLGTPGHDRERALALDALTTHETSFFRESQHFPAILEHARVPRPGRKFRLWSAACSTGEEAWSLAMLLATRSSPDSWQIVGTDVSAPSVESANRALYALERSGTIPPELLRRFCRKGRDQYEGTFLIDASLRENVSFSVANICNPQPALGSFDVIVLRNVLIYFEAAERMRIVNNLVERLAPGGLLVNGHAESVTGMHRELVPVAQTIHRRVPLAQRGAA